MWPYLPGSLVLLPFFQKDFLEASTFAIFAGATSSDTPSPVKTLKTILDVYIPILWLGFDRDVMNNHVIPQLTAHEALALRASCFARARWPEKQLPVHQCAAHAL